jgi:hypothetical protein
MRMKLAGAKTGASNSSAEEKTTTTTLLGRTKSGARVESKKERVRPKQPIGDLVLNKKTGKVVRYNQPELPD